MENETKKFISFANFMNESVEELAEEMSYTDKIILPTNSKVFLESTKDLVGEELKGANKKFLELVNTEIENAVTPRQMMSPYCRARDTELERKAFHKWGSMLKDATIHDIITFMYILGEDMYFDRHAYIPTTNEYAYKSVKSFNDALLGLVDFYETFPKHEHFVWWLEDSIVEKMVMYAKSKKQMMIATDYHKWLRWESSKTTVEAFNKKRSKFDFVDADNTKVKKVAKIDYDLRVKFEKMEKPTNRKGHNKQKMAEYKACENQIRQAKKSLDELYIQQVIEAPYFERAILSTRYIQANCKFARPAVQSLLDKCTEAHHYRQTYRYAQKMFGCKSIANQTIKMWDAKTLKDITKIETAKQAKQLAESCFQGKPRLLALKLAKRLFETEQKENQSNN